MKQYLNVLTNILDNGVEKESGRDNMPPVLGISGDEIKMNLQDGFPLLTTKKMPWKGIIHELLWFMSGNTNIKYLVDNKVNIWNGDAYRWYQKKMNEIGQPYHFNTIEKFVNAIKNQPDGYLGEEGHYRLGDLGKVYGHQWRNQNGCDQLKDLIDGLKNEPFARRHIIDAWNKADLNDMALPPCHVFYQFIVRPLTQKDKVNWLNENYAMYDQKPWTLEMLKFEENNGNIEAHYNMPKYFLDLNMYQRSCDTFLGVPFNIASMSAFLMIIAKACGMMPGISKWIGGDVHLYLPHITLAKEQLQRVPHQLPKLIIKKELKNLDDILKLTIDDFEIYGYNPHPPIEAELFTGYKI